MEQRKQEHIALALEQTENSRSCFDAYAFRHVALPEIDFSSIKTDTVFLGKPLSFPLLIASMTGGTEEAKLINQRIARLCQKYKIAMGVGSQRIALEHPEKSSSFAVRSIAPDIVLLGNIGAVQLNYGFNKAHLQQAISMIDADGLFLHLNPLQEAIQPEGNTNFSQLLPKLQALIPQISKPIIIKEVGNGISRDVAKKLFSIGIKTIAVEGSGGTNWATIEGARAQSPLGDLFASWGMPTSQCIEECVSLEGLTVIAGGGIRDGIAMAKSLALGASVVSIGKPILRATLESYEVAEQYVLNLINTVKIAMFCSGVSSIDALRLRGKEILEKK